MIVSNTVAPVKLLISRLKAALLVVDRQWALDAPRQQTQVTMLNQSAKRYIFGAVNYVTAALGWVPWPNKNIVSFRQLLQPVMTHDKQTPAKAVIVLDNFRIHKAKAVRAWWPTHRAELQLYFLPTYSPG